jgi:hypothetical protein
MAACRRTNVLFSLFNSPRLQPRISGMCICNAKRETLLAIKSPFSSILAKNEDDNTDSQNGLCRHSLK